MLLVYLLNVRFFKIDIRNERTLSFCIQNVRLFYSSPFSKFILRCVPSQNGLFFE